MCDDIPVEVGQAAQERLIFALLRVFSSSPTVLCSSIATLSFLHTNRQCSFSSSHRLLHLPGFEAHMIQPDIVGELEGIFFKGMLVNTINTPACCAYFRLHNSPKWRTADDEHVHALFWVPGFQHIVDELEITNGPL